MLNQLITRKNIIFEPNIKRVILQFFHPGSEERAQSIINKVLALSEPEVIEQSANLIDSFKDRHINYSESIFENFFKIKNLVPSSKSLSSDLKLLLGACFTREYSFEAAALMNPSIVALPHYGTSVDNCKFIVSTRAVGEGHISSIGFVNGEINFDGEIIVEPMNDLACSPKVRANNSKNEVEIEFEKNSKISERIIYPVMADECNGIEDLRLVRFINDQNKIQYYGTYTAYDGKNINIKFLETTDFLRFKTYRLKGKCVNNKGMALFPRKVNGKYMMISRLDGENLFIMESDTLMNWDNAKTILKPELHWEFVQLGNCGSPIETDDGWLLVIHGVGYMRQYVIGVCLLDKSDPSKIKARLKTPLITPNQYERDGYVPNVVYSCGSIIFNGELIIPYAMSDYKWGFASAKVSELIERMN